MKKVINVVDDIMGKGKTSWAMKHMLMNKDHNYIYVTPFLEEVERCSKFCGFKEPNRVNGDGKLESFKSLIAQNENISTTHELFKLIDKECIEILTNGNYTLILDEVLDVLEETTMEKGDIDNLIELGILKYNEKEELVSGDDDAIKKKADEPNKYQHIALNLMRKNLEILNGNRKIALLWLFPIDVIDCFEEIYIMTFMFDGYPMSGYLKYHKYKIKKYSIEVINKNDTYENRVFKLTDYIFPDVKDLKNLINIAQSVKMNEIGDKDNSLSYSWWEARVKDKHHIDWITIKNNMNNFINNYSNTKSRKKIIWTSFKRTRSSLYTKVLNDDNFVSYNLRATNKHSDKTSLIYLVNKNYNPVILSWFSKNKIKVDRDAYALGECVQLIWRTSIRNGEPITLYIPSKKMRKLLELFLNGEYFIKTEGGLN